MCVALPEAGVLGATCSIEGKIGFLQAYSPSQDKSLQHLTSGHGQEWTWLESSLKPYPACRMTHTLIEMAGNLHDTRVVRQADDSAIKLQMQPTNLSLVGDSTPNKVLPENHIDAQFSVYYQVANALLHGSTTGMKAYDKLQDPDIRALCTKTTISSNASMTDFSGRMRVEWSDGSVDETQQQYPLGEVQHPFVKEKVEEKFMSLVEPVFGVDRARAIVRNVDELEGHTISQLLALLH